MKDTGEPSKPRKAADHGDHQGVTQTDGKNIAAAHIVSDQQTEARTAKPQIPGDKTGSGSHGDSGSIGAADNRGTLEVPTGIALIKSNDRARASESTEAASALTRSIGDATNANDPLARQSGDNTLDVGQAGAGRQAGKQYADTSPNTQGNDAAPAVPPEGQGDSRITKILNHLFMPQQPPESAPNSQQPGGGQPGEVPKPAQSQQGDTTQTPTEQRTAPQGAYQPPIDRDKAYQDARDTYLQRLNDPEQPDTSVAKFNVAQTLYNKAAESGQLDNPQLTTDLQHLYPQDEKAIYALGVKEYLNRKRKNFDQIPSY